MNLARLPWEFTLGTLLLLIGARAVLASGPGACAGTGHQSGNPVTRTMSCAGTCPLPDGQSCQTHVTNGVPNGRGVFPPGHPHAGKSFAWCACPGEGISACCKLVGLLNPPGDAITEFTVHGSCPTCPASGVCDTATTSQGVEAACR